MPNRPRYLDSTAVIFRMPRAGISWLRELASARGTNISETLRTVVDDARTLYGIPDSIRERLLDDARGQGKDLRRYLADLLARRYEKLVTDEALDRRVPSLTPLPARASAPPASEWTPPPDVPHFTPSRLRGR